MLRFLQCRVEPEAIRRRHWSVSRLREPPEYNPAKVGPVDCQRNGLAKLRRSEPRLFVFRQRRHRGLVKPELFRVEPSSCAAGDGGIFALQPLELLRVNTIDQLQFAASKPDEFNVAVTLNVKLNAVE